MTCQSCIDKIVKPGKQCVACDGRAKEKDLVELKRDGTGFAAAGGAESVKVRVVSWANAPSVEAGTMETTALTLCSAIRFVNSRLGRRSNRQFREASETIFV